MDIRGVGRTLRRSWWIILLAGVLGAGIGAFITLESEPKYASTVTFFVQTPPGGNSSAYQGDQFGQKRVNTYIELVSSESLAQRIVDSTQVDLTAAQVSSRLSGKGDLNTVILTVTATDSDPTRSLELATAVSKELVDLVASIETPEGSDTPSVYLHVVSGPTLNPQPVSPRPTLNIGLGLFVGLILGLAVAVLRDITDRSIRSVDILRSVSEYPVLAVITFDPSAKKSPLIVHDRSRSVRAEAFRHLRTNLQFVDVDSPVRTILVTSSVAHEGKSTTATNLAVTFAETGRSVLLIEGDLRRPRVADYLGIEGAIGLTNVLAGQVHIDDVLQPWGRGGLTVLPSGSIPPNPSELLGSKHMGELLAGLKKRFDLIIFDTPPLLPVTDAAVAADHADGVVVVVRQGKTTRDQLAAALSMIEVVDTRILGCVLNMVPSKGADVYGADYGYGYYDDESGGRARLLDGTENADAAPDAAAASTQPSATSSHGYVSGSTQNGSARQGVPARHNQDDASQRGRRWLSPERTN